MLEELDALSKGDNNDPSVVATPPEIAVSKRSAADGEKRIVTVADYQDEQKVVQRFAMLAMEFGAVGMAQPDIADRLFLVDECNWDGVECGNGEDGSAEVTKIRWDYRNLTGSVSSAIGLLSSISSLDLSNNVLVGTIPESLYRLTDLKELRLYKNDLGGTLSSRIGDLDKLERFHLSHNSFSGTLPSELKSDGGSENGIRPIRYFNVYSNQLTGSLPEGLRLRQCLYFDVGENYFTGTLPQDIGDKFVELRMLYLDHNAFSGTLPSSYNTVGNGRLNILAIEHNQLTGIVPSGDREFNNLDNLSSYTLQANQFTGMENLQICSIQGMVEFKADCYPAMVCGCWGPLFEFCDRYCAGSSDNMRPPSSSSDNFAPANGNVVGNNADYYSDYWYGQQQQQQNYYYPDNNWGWWQQQQQPQPNPDDYWGWWQQQQQPEPDRRPQNGYWERQPAF